MKLVLKSEKLNFHMTPVKLSRSKFTEVASISNLSSFCVPRLPFYIEKGGVRKCMEIVLLQHERRKDVGARFPYISSQIMCRFGGSLLRQRWIQEYSIIIRVSKVTFSYLKCFFLCWKRELASTCNQIRCELSLWKSSHESKDDNWNLSYNMGADFVANTHGGWHAQIIIDYL